MICHYYLTYDCNCRCEYCPTWQDASIEQQIYASEKDVIQNIKDLHNLGVKKIFFTGGEPFLYESLADVCRFAKSLDFEVLLSTNGLISSKKLPSLAKYIDNLFVSLAYPVREEHDRAKGQECFQETLDTVSACLHFGVNVVIDYLLTRDSVRFLPEVIDLATEKKAMLRFNFVHHCFEIEGFEDITFEYIKRYANHPLVIFDERLFSLARKGGNDISSPSCNVLSNVITISPDNNLLLPCFWARESSIPINGKLTDLFTTEIFKSYKSLQGKLSSCKGCVAGEIFEDLDFKSVLVKKNLYKKFSNFLREIKMLLFG